VRPTTGSTSRSGWPAWRVPPKRSTPASAPGPGAAGCRAADRPSRSSSTPRLADTVAAALPDTGHVKRLRIAERGVHVLAST
jgi:hypothetical protein